MPFREAVKNYSADFSAKGVPPRGPGNRKAFPEKIPYIFSKVMYRDGTFGLPGEAEGSGSWSKVQFIIIYNL